MFLQLCAIILICVVAFLYILHTFYLRWSAKYWPGRGVNYLNPREIMSLLEGITFKVSPAQTIQRIYEKSVGHKYVGYMELTTPVLFVRDLDFLKTILVKDFDHFGERRGFKSIKSEPLPSKMLTNLNGAEWKDMRSHLSPTFTTGKIKRMFPLFNSCGHHMTQYLKKIIQAGEDQEINFQDCFGRYTIDGIANIAFGLNTDVFEEDSQFRQMTKKMQEISVSRYIKIIIIYFFPKLASLLSLRVSEPESMKFFESIMKQNMTQRRQEENRREDFVQLLIELQAGQLKPDQNDEVTATEMRGTQLGHKVTIMDDESIMAQCLLFFSAGFDTIETLLTFCSYCLALDPQVQEKLAEEVSRSMDQNDGNLDYESINQMEFMDMVISETLRLYPPAVLVDRTCTKDYTIPGTQIQIPKGCRLLVPIHSIHHDESYYPNPDQFNPDHFTPENKLKRHPYAYLPFGHGPRNCIAMRFALAEAKAAIAHLVYNFRIEPCEKTQIPLRMAKTSLILKPEKGMFLKFTARRDDDHHNN